MAHTVIVYAGRTPVGKLSGAFSNLPAPRLGATLVKDALAKTKIDPSKVDEIVMGNVLSAGVGQAPARQAAIYGGLPKSVCATTINRVCGSGLKAVMMADQAIRLGDAKIVFAGGQENMTLAPHLLMNSRAGYKFGSVEVKDHMQWDGLWDPYGSVAMGNCGELCAKEYKFSREDQDKYAQESYARARNAWESGHFKNEVVAVEVPGRKGPVMVDKDEEPFAADLAKLPELRPAFDKTGTITAGNASSINDGAALVVACSEEKAKELEKPKKAEEAKALTPAQIKANAAAEKARADQLARLRAAAGAEGGSGGQVGSNVGGGGNAPPAYADKVRRKIKPLIVFNPESITGNPAVVVLVDLAPDGAILKRSVVTSFFIHI